jgi:hypothetical protein
MSTYYSGNGPNHRGRAKAGRDYAPCDKCRRVCRKCALDENGKCGACGKGNAPWNGLPSSLPPVMMGQARRRGSLN